MSGIDIGLTLAQTKIQNALINTLKFYTNERF